MEKRESPVCFRPADKTKQLLDKYCGHTALMSKSQLVEIAFKFLLQLPEKELDKIIWKFLTGKGDENG